MLNTSSPTSRPRAARARRSSSRFRPGVDVLEDRALLSQVYHVTDGASLAAAVASADGQSGAAEIVLDKAGIYSVPSALTISVDLTITGLNGHRPDLYVIQPASGVTDRVFEVTGASNVTIRDVTIQGGSTSGNGGGIDLATAGARLDLGNVVIQNNTAGGDGGGVYVADGAGLRITNSVLQNNTASGDGGGVDFNASGQAATVVIDSTIVSGNKALGTNGMGDGGGVIVQATTPASASSSDRPPAVDLNLRDTTLLNNTSAHDGGGLWASDVTNLRANGVFAINNTSVQDAGGFGDSATHLNGASFTATGCFVASNQVTGPGTDTAPDGGGVCFDFAPMGSTPAPTGQVTATVTNNAFVGNSVVGAGGGLYVRDKGTQTSFQANISRNIILGNHVTASTFDSDDNGKGGGLYVRGSGSTNQLMLGQNFVAGNATATDGGGLYFRLDSGSATVNGNAFLGNSAGNDGGGIALTGDPSSSTPGGAVTLSNNRLIVNSATRNGGGLAVASTGMASLNGDWIMLNKAGAAGGGVFNDGGTLSVANSFIILNTAPTDPNVSGPYTDQGGNIIH